MRRDSSRLMSTRTSMLRLPVGPELARQQVLVRERVLLRVTLDEEVERVDGRHLGDQVDLDGQLARRLREGQPRLVIAERILLPVEEVLLRLDAQRIAGDHRPAVRRRPQADDVRRERDRPVVAVPRGVRERDSDRHAGLRVTLLDNRLTSVYGTVNNTKLRRLIGGPARPQT
jgi:hypothetical protein